MPSASTVSAAAVFPSVQSTRPIRQSSRERSTGSWTWGSARSSTSSASANANEASASCAASRQTGTASSKRAAPRRCRATCSALAPAAERTSAARPWISCRRGRTISSAIASWVSACRQRYVACPAADLFDHLLRDADCERALNDRVRKAGDGEERRVVERPAEHGGGLQDLRLGRIEPREAQQDRVAHRLGNPHLRQRAAIPAVRRAKDVAAVDRLSEHLLEHERISLRPRVHQVAELQPDLLVVEDRRDHLGDLRLSEG